MMRDERGQSTIEFALTIALLLSFTMFYIHLSFAFAFGSYVQYATFMSARALLAAGPSPEDQEERARKVIVGMLKQRGSPGADRWPFIAKGAGGGAPNGVQIGPGPGFVAGDPNSSWMMGVRYTFKVKLFLMLLGGAESEGEGGGSFNLTSESWLGREPSFEDCVEDLTGRVGGAEFDNGC